LSCGVSCTTGWCVRGVAIVEVQAQEGCLAHTRIRRRERGRDRRREAGYR
jgi:hypothetical protein